MLLKEKERAVQEKMTASGKSGSEGNKSCMFKDHFLLTYLYM